MPLELQDLKKMFDKAYTYNQVTRERAADDLVFYWVTQWGSRLQGNLLYKGEFNIIRKAGRQILSDLKANPVQVDFQAANGTGEDAADTLDGIYRTDDNQNSSIEAYNVAAQEAVVCGVGAWELYTEYESMHTLDNNQVIRRRPIYEANNTVFWDPNAKMLDKSDATYCPVLTGYTEDGYIALVKELTGREMESVDAGSFKEPEISYIFPWIGGQGKTIHVVSFYHREKYTTTLYDIESPHGSVTQYWKEELEGDDLDKFKADGFIITSEKEVERWKVTKYIASGAEILSAEVIAGEYIPVIPEYGERAYVEDAEHYEGITRLAKDPQRLRNFMMSYLADIVSKSPRAKPIFWQEQLGEYADMYAEDGSENDYPYMLMKRFDLNGKELPVGPVAIMPEQQMPQSLAAMLDQTRIAVEDVANPGLPQDIADPDVSGKAVMALQARLDMQSQIYQENGKHAKRWDGTVYASMASAIYDVPRSATMTLVDGTMKDVDIMQDDMDEGGELTVKNDLHNAEFKVYSTIGPSYSSQKEQTIEQLNSIYQGMAPGDPKRAIIELEMIQLMQGAGMDDLRDYARKQLILMEVKEPETDDEKKMLAEAKAQPPEPDADMALAMAEMEKAKADQADAKVNAGKLEVEARNNEAKNLIAKFEAETGRIEAMTKAAEAGVTIDMKKVETFGKQVDNAQKIKELRTPLLTE